MGHELRECEQCAEHANTIEQQDEELESLRQDKERLEEKVEELEGKLDSLRDPLDEIFRCTQTALKSL